MFRKLPTELEFSFAPEAAIYMPGRIVPTIVRGYGDITLSFEATDQPEVLSVGLRDVRLRLVPFTFPIDVDQDGRLESIELSNVVLDRAFFDCDASKGTLNLETGDFEMVFEYVVTPKGVPLLEKLGERTVRFTVTDRGKMDLKEWSFEIHSGVIKVEEGPLAGARIRGGGCGKIITKPKPPPPPPSTVNLTVVILTPGTSNCEAVRQESVMICPGDKVLLCWTSSTDVVSVVLDPGGVELPATGVYDTTPVRPPADEPPQVVYRVKTKGGNTDVEDTVVVQFYNKQWLGPYMAQPDGYHWTIDIHPQSVSGKIAVREVQLVKDECLQWEKFFLEHSPAPPPAGPGGGPDFGGSIEGFNPVAIPVSFRAAGNWSFYAEVDPPSAAPQAEKDTPPVCFKFKGECEP